MRDLDWYRQLEGLVENSPDGEITCAGTGRITFANARAAELLGRPRSELIGKTYGEAPWKLTNLAGQVLTDAVLPPAQATRFARTVVDFEHVVEHADGRRTVISANARPLIAENGAVTQVILTLRDITEHKRADDQLRESEWHYRMLAESSDDYIFVLDRDERIQYVNGAAATLFEAKPQEVVGRRLEGHFGPELCARLKRNLRMVFYLGRPASIEGMATAFERELWLSVRLVPLRDERDDVTGVMVVSSDITERKSIEAALKENEQRYRILFADSPAALWEVDMSAVKNFFDRLHAAGVRDFREHFEAHPDDLIECARLINVLDINKAAVETFRADNPDQLKASLAEVIRPSLHPGFRNQMSALAEGETRFEGETYAWALDGERRDISIQLLVPQGYEKTLKKMITSIVDITDRKREKALDDALNDINETVTSKLKLAQVTEVVVSKGVGALGGDYGAIIVCEGDDWLVRGIHGFPGKVAGKRLEGHESKALQRVARTGEILISNDACEDPRLNQKRAKEFGIRAFSLAPLIVRDEVIGAILLGYRRAGQLFGEVEVDFIEKLATSVSLAMENARLYEAELEVSHTLQETMLTMPKSIEGITFDYLYRSAAEAARVGGDFYDLFELENGKIGIVVGDVSGKGLEAATITSLVKNTLRAYAYQHGSPAHVMALTNEAVIRATGESMFVTAFYGVIDKISGELVYCGAGHPPAILRRAAGDISMLATSCPAIGVFSGLPYSDSMAQIKTGDYLVLYTDGVTEARREHELFGEERLVRLIDGLDSARAVSPQAIFDCITEFADTELHDDVAILCIGLTDSSRSRLARGQAAA